MMIDTGAYYRSVLSGVLYRVTGVDVENGQTVLILKQKGKPELIKCTLEDFVGRYVNLDA